ncbi:hypothetical protein [Fuscibacter oryzae]|uniref:Uncharacterized protein n=1 Tax=Fuscibacter oryzae TaxID=2803939 RepID=A0A8J7SSS9_9RHOB|nr:hypothetical protein [Fuscibacter oryzae]MBL4926972.1 hypothetical protein [Fuscibacter oryzae]
MKIVVNSTDRLILRSRPLLLAAIIGGGIAIFAAVVIANAIAGNSAEAERAALPMGMLLIAFVVFVRETVATFDRTAGEVVIARRSVFGRSGIRLELSDIRQAKLEADPGKERTKSGHPLQRAVLVLIDGKVVPLTGTYSADTGTTQAVTAMKAWLQPRKPKRG